jgi:hypothetical protein
VTSPRPRSESYRGWGMRDRQPLSLVLGVVVAAAAAGATTLILYSPVDMRPTCSGGVPPGPLSRDNPGCHFGPWPAEWVQQQQQLALLVFLVVLVAGFLTVWAVQRWRTRTRA